MALPRLHPWHSLVLAFSLLLPAASVAQNEKFNGDWVLDNSKSQNTGLASATQTIRVEDGKLHVARTVRRAFQEPESYEYFYTTDGQLREVTGPPHITRELTAEWAGRNLEVRWEFDFQGERVGRGVEIWRTRGKNLEIGIVATVPQGERVIKFVYVPAK